MCLVVSKQISWEAQICNYIMWQRAGGQTNCGLNWVSEAQSSLVIGCYWQYNLLIRGVWGVACKT